MHNSHCYTPTESIHKLFSLVGELEGKYKCFTNIVGKQIELQNEDIKFLMGTGLKQELDKIINKMLVDGTFEELINQNIFGELNTSLQNTISSLDLTIKKVEENKLSIGNIDKTVNSINLKVGDLENEITNLSNAYDGISLTLLQYENDISLLKNKVENLETKKVNVDIEKTGLKMVAHRGLSQVAPENTLLAYELASKNNFEYVETDIAINYSNDWILMHDSTVDRTTNGTGNVSELTSDYIKSLIIDSGSNADLYTGLKVPFLDDFLQLCNRLNLKPLLEVKSVNNESSLQKLIDKIKLYGLYEESRIISFNINTLKLIRTLDKNIKLTIVSEGDINQNLINECLSIKNCDFSVSAPSQFMINKCKELGIKVNCWTVNDFKKASELKSYGIDFITTDILKEVF